MSAVARNRILPLGVFGALIATSTYKLESHNLLTEKNLFLFGLSIVVLILFGNALRDRAHHGSYSGFSVFGLFMGASIAWTIITNYSQHLMSIGILMAVLLGVLVFGLVVIVGIPPTGLEASLLNKFGARKPTVPQESFYNEGTDIFRKREFDAVSDDNEPQPA